MYNKYIKKNGNAHNIFKLLKALKKYSYLKYFFMISG